MPTKTHRPARATARTKVLRPLQTPVGNPDLPPRVIRQALLKVMEQKDQTRTAAASRREIKRHG
jgi:hypothetical protein